MKALRGVGVVVLSNDNDDGVEPLEPNIWFARFGTIKARASHQDLRSPAQPLRQVFHLLQLCPGPLKHLLAPDIDEARFERFLECEAYQSAALALAGPAIDYTISTYAQSGCVTVAIRCADHREASSETAADLATAFILAYCACITALFDGVGALGEVSPPPQQTGQSARPRQQTAPQAFSSYLPDAPQQSAD